MQLIDSPEGACATGRPPPHAAHSTPHHHFISFPWQVLDAELAILDEIDSGLDVDALRDVGDACNALRAPHKALLLITHYRRLLDYIPPTFVHIMVRRGKDGEGEGWRGGREGGMEGGKEHGEYQGLPLGKEVVSTCMKGPITAARWCLRGVHQ